MRRTSQMLHVARSVGAVLAGFASVFVLSVTTDAVFHGVGIYPPKGQTMSDQMFVIPAVYRAAYTVVGGYLTARLAPYRPAAHVWVLAGLGTVGGLAGVMVYLGDSTGTFGPAWYSYSILAGAVPLVLLGGWLHLRRTGGPAALGAT